MTYEVELKFPIGDADQLATKLASLKAEFHAAVVQHDRYFAHPARDFAGTDEALRIRRVGQANYVTYKGPKIDATTKTRREIELPLESGDRGASQFSEFLTALGFTALADVRKTRRPLTVDWKGWRVQAALDEVEGLGSFAELELFVDEEHIEAAKAAIGSLSAELGLSGSIRRSYLELLLDRGATGAK
jgi:adenylate cyclase class 2